MSETIESPPRVTKALTISIYDDDQARIDGLLVKAGPRSKVSQVLREAIITECLKQGIDPDNPLS
jgi:hypothetical protein